MIMNEILLEYVLAQSAIELKLILGVMATLSAE